MVFSELDHFHFHGRFEPPRSIRVYPSFTRPESERKKKKADFKWMTGIDDLQAFFFKQRFGS